MSNEQWLADVVRTIFESGAAPPCRNALCACMTALSATAETDLPVPIVRIDGEAPWADVEAEFAFPGGAVATITAHGEDWHPRHEDPDKRLPRNASIALYAHGLSPWHLVDFVRAAVAMPQRKLNPPDGVWTDEEA